MTLASLARTRLLRATAAFLVAISALVLVPGSDTATAAGTPNVSFTKTAPAEALAGDTAIPVTLTATNTSGATDGFNLTFVDVLPPGVSFGSSTPAPSQILTNTPHTGETTVVWRNVADLQAGVTQSLTYTMSAGTLPVGTTITNSRSGHNHQASAHVNQDPRVVPTYNTSSNSVDNSDGYDSSGSSTLLLPFILEKMEPSTEDELLRGLHDHQTVYTFKISNNHLAATNSFSIQDWIPAGMEFLGCGGVDNSTGEEYSGSGPINPGNEPAMANPCVAPDTVETVVVDPPGGAPNDVYTHVVWTAPTLATNLAASQIVYFDYIAAIPLLENATTWDKAVPTDPDPLTDGPQIANLDNNNGASTQETASEQPMTNTARATGIYAGNGSTYNDDDALTVDSEDLSIHKTANQDDITHGAGTTWTLTIETSEYVGTASSIVVTDTIPDGLDFAGASQAASSGPTNQPDGTQIVEWTVAPMGASETTVITFDTTTRSTYRATGDPVLANDSWTNTVALAGSVDGRTVADVSSDGQSAGPVVIVKEVSDRQDPFTACTAIPGGEWNTSLATGYHLGDQACWRLGVDFPIDLDTFDSDIQDYLPSGHVYTAADSWSFGGNNTVPAGDVSGPDAGDIGATVLTWTVGDGGGYVAEDEYFEIVFSSTVVDANATSSGEIVENLMKYSYVNTSGTPFNLRDLADIEVLEAQLDLVKGVAAVNTVSTGGTNVDGVSVMEADVITYLLTITNEGDLDATDVEVWDLLPPEYDPCGTLVSAISDSGSCATDTRLEWAGLTVPANSSIAVTYDVTFPTGVAPAEVVPNDAGVRSYTSATNNGAGTFTYIPASNIDPAAPVANTTVADDPSSVLTSDVTIDKARTTAVDESGNALLDQATIGEIITYTITVVIPEGTTVGNAALVDDLPPNLDLILPATVTFDGVGGNGAIGVLANPVNDVITAALSDTDYTNPPGSGDDTLTLTVAARVIDVPQNAHNGTISNTATFSWDNHDTIPVTFSRSDSIDTTVVEPRMSIGKTSVDGIGNNGVVVGNETVDYTLAINNGSGASVAHDLVVVDTLPIGLTPTGLTPTGPTTGLTADGGVWDSITRTITWNIASLATNTTVNRNYSVVVDTPIIVSTDLTNTVVVDTTSLAGPSSDERTSGSRYSATDSDTQTSPLASIAKSVDPTSATIGDSLTYTIDVTIPPGTIMYDATVIDTLEPGLSYDGMFGVSVCDMNGSACDPDITATDIGVIGSQAVGFWLDDIVPASVTGETRVVTITYKAHVLNSLNRGDTPDNSATVYGNQTNKILVDPTTPPAAGGFDVDAGPAIATVTIVEPSLTIDKDVSGQVGDSDYRRAQPGDVLTFTVTVANGGANGSDAHNITVVDTLTDLSYISVGPITGGGVWDPGTDTITWIVAGPLATGNSLSFTYDVTIDTPLGVGVENPSAAELINTADVPSYFGVSASDRAANPAWSFNEYDDVVPDVVEVELDLASIGDYIWFDVDGDDAQDPSEPDLAGVRVTVTYLGLDDAPGGGDDEVHEVTTDSNGLYLVDELPGGNYTVTVNTADIPAGMTANWDLDGGSDGAWAGALAENADKLDVDFAYVGTGSIGDNVSWDVDNSGAFTAGDIGLANVGVTVTWLGFDDAVGGGDDVVYATATDGNGDYLVPNLAAGEYTIVVDPATLPSGMTQTYDADGMASADMSSYSLAAGEDNDAQDFGYTGDGSIGDLVWLDTNADGLVTAGEPGIPGIPVQLTWAGEDGVLGNADDHVFTTTTDSDGGYTFPNLPGDLYQVDVLGGLPLAATNTADYDGDLDSSTPVTLGDGVDFEDADFGYDGDAFIGDTVWWDVNDNGVVDAGEPGFGGVDVELTYAGPDGTIGTSDDLVFTTTTDSNGNYVFGDLPTGNYVVAVTGGIPTGFGPTYDEDGSDDETSVVTGLSSMDFHDTADFGYRGSGSIGDLLYLDSNANGFHNPGEPGIPGVDVELIWDGVDGIAGTSDDVTLSATTDAVGDYLFDFLPAGDYEVAVQTATLPAGLTLTGDPDGLGTPDTSSLTLTTGEDNDLQDFGYTGGASVGDTVWFDRNNDGVHDADEYGIGGVDVWVIWAGPDGLLDTADDETFGATTDIDGEYEVTNLPPGEYRVWVDTATLPAGMAATFDEDGVLDDLTEFTLADLEVHDTADFGYTGSGQIGDLVWLDLDSDGDNTGEPGIPGQTVTLTWEGPDSVPGNADDQVYTTTTDVDGIYVFDNLPPGGYEVEVTGPIVTAAVNTDDEDGDDDSHTPVALGDGAVHDTADFGYVGSAEVGDLVWLDLDGDGTTGLSEPGIAGVAVTVTWYGDDGVAGGGDDVTLPALATDALGNYLATGLPDGDYGVAVTAGVPAGLVNSADEDGDLDDQTDVAGLVAGDSHLTADFGYTGAGAIGDTVWWDLDGDGAQGITEPGFAGVDVTLTWAGLDGVFGNGDDAVFATTTDAAGAYLFEYLPPGEFQVVIDETGLPIGVAQSADPDAVLDGSSAVTLGSGEINLDQDFGYRGEGSVGDFVWYDINNDGVADPDEPGVADVVVTVTFLGNDGVVGGGDDVVFTAVTDSNGNYTVPGLPSGFYTAQIDESTLPSGLTANGDLDGGDPVVTLFTLGAAEDKTDVDYPVVGDASLSGTVWNDVDGDETIDSTEPGIAGVTVIITWDGPDGPVVMTVVSGPDGIWDLPSLPSGDFTVELNLTTVPDDMSPTTGTDESVTLPVGGHEVVDFGLAELVDLGSTVWIDTDGDGLVDPDEQGIPSVMVNLYDEDGLLIAITATNADGEYLFEDLLPGTYVVTIMSESLPEELRATFDRDGSPDLTTLVHLTIGVDILDANFGFQVGLPVTGFEVETFALFGLLAVILGAVLVASSRTRRKFSLVR
ncbi:MAG: isopeptide-forming domain-containing fimbrial protein [bacterium]|nr:isopeptide-forming domain-containing fimbrial protein [bacterium]